MKRAWGRLPAIPRADSGNTDRYGGAMAAINGKLYLVGGWRISPALPASCSGLAAGVIGASVLAVGGMTAAASWGRLRSCSVREGSSQANPVEGRGYLLQPLAGVHMFRGRRKRSSIPSGLTERGCNIGNFLIDGPFCSPCSPSSVSEGIA